MSFNLEDYEPVATRLARWLENTDGQPRVITHLVHYTEGQSCVFRAELWVNDILISTGWAEEHVEDRGVNKTSHLENAESSSVGRALANAGLAGSDPAKRASREEMSKVQRMGGQPAQYTTKPQGMASEKQRQFIRDLAAKKKLEVALPQELTFQDASKLIDYLKAGKLPPEFMTDLGSEQADADDEEPF